jgi:hypothetical protein
MKSIKNITKGIIKIHYTALHCSVTIYETILCIGKYYKKPPIIKTQTKTSLTKY